MKFKTRNTYGTWSKTTVHRTRRLSMPQFAASLPAEHAADAAALRCECFRRMKRITKLPKRHMTQEVMKQLCG